jgi:hypothetical protein
VNGSPSPAVSNPAVSAPQSPQERARVERWASTGCVDCGAAEGHETGCWYLASP